MNAHAKETTRSSYENTATEYAKNVASLAPIQSIEYLISLLPQGASILDLGCGSGRDARIMAEMGANVVGIDYCAALLEIAKQDAPSVEFKLMDIEHLDFSDASFDAIWAACALAHLSKNQLPEILENIHSLLKQDGYFHLALKEGNGEFLEIDSRYEGNHQKFWAYYQKEEGYFR